MTEKSNSEAYAKAWEIIFHWWTELKGNSGGRAELRRSKSFQEAAMERTFYELYKALDQKEVPDSIRSRLTYNLPIVAGVLAHVEENSTLPVAQVMGKGKKESSDTPVVSDLRFRRLLRIEGSDDDGRNELYVTIIRVIRMLDKKANVRDLAQSLLFWNEKTRKKWASLYYIHRDMFDNKNETTKKGA